jgi:hypothetical protein
MHVGRVKSAQQPAPQPFGVAVPAPRSVLLPPTFFPYVGARRLFSQLGASLTSGATAVVATVALNASEIGAISDIEIGINNMLTTTVATWAVRFNGGPINWGPLSLIPRAATYAGSAWSQLGLPIPIGINVVDILATVSDAGTYLVGASITGWVWTQDMEQNVRLGRIAG